MGARATATARPLFGDASHENRRLACGGQRSPAGFFGLSVVAFTGSAPEAKAVRTQAKAVAPAPAVSLTPAVQDAIRDADFYGDARPSTPAMQATARASAMRDEREWSEYADLVASYPALPYGSVETACDLND